ncbi:MAG: universal stress protein [Alphaproteobacteria bacterium]
MRGFENILFVFEASLDDDAALSREVDLIVMGTLARSGVPGFFMGNTAVDGLRQVDTSVVTLKPEGFSSPVTVSA